MSRIPVELIDAVLEHLIDDKPALLACCLVCKAWVHSSRRLLFDALILRYRTVAGAPTKADDDMHISTWPLAMWPYIRRLFLVNEFPPLPWNDLLPVIRTLENLRPLTVTSLPHEIVHHPSLHLSSPGHARPLARTMAEVDPPSPTISPSHSLRALELLDCDWVALLQWLMSFDHAPTLHSRAPHHCLHKQWCVAVSSTVVQAQLPFGLLL